jgi:F-type H+-transporting ATPase subunit delta
MMISEVSRRYARALYEHAKSGNNSDRVLSELRSLNQAVQSEPAILEFLNQPLISPDNKISALTKALSGKVSPEVLSTLTLLAEKNRLGIFSELAQAFETIIDSDHGVTRGTVRSASALSPEARKKIEDKINQVTGKKVILTFTEDSKLLGGMVAQVGGWTFDDSLDSHLHRLNEELNRRSH